MTLTTPQPTYIILYHIYLHYMILYIYIIYTFIHIYIFIYEARLQLKHDIYIYISKAGVKHIFICKDIHKYISKAGVKHIHL